MDLVVLGAGGHGKVVADAAQSAGFRVLGFADDDKARRNQQILALSVIATGMDEVADLCVGNGASVAVALGENRARATAFAELERRGLNVATVIHPSAIISASATIGRGTVVLAGAVINCETRVGTNAIINTGARIDHDCSIASHAHLSPGVVLGGTVHVGEGTHLGVGVAVRNNISIGAWSVVGVGAAVVADVPDAVLAWGVPAKVVRPLPPGK